MRNIVQKPSSPDFAPVAGVGLDATLPESGSLRQAKTEVAGSLVAPKEEKPPLLDTEDIPPGF